MNFGVKMQGGEPASVLKVSESEGKLEGLATAVTPSKNSGSSCGGAISSSSSSGSSRGGGAKGWQYRYGPPKGCSGADSGGFGGGGCLHIAVGRPLPKQLITFLGARPASMNRTHFIQKYIQQVFVEAF